LKKSRAKYLEILSRVYLSKYDFIQQE